MKINKIVLDTEMSTTNMSDLTSKIISSLKCNFYVIKLLTNKIQKSDRRYKWWNHELSLNKIKKMKKENN
jgi:hypothetical protein